MPIFSLDSLPQTLIAGRMKYETGWQKQGRRLKRPALYYVFSGILRFSLGLQNVSLPAGTAVLLEEDTAYSVCAVEDCDYCYFHFTMSRTEEDKLYFTKSDSHPLIGQLQPRETGFFLPSATPINASREQVEHLAVSALRHAPCSHTFDKTRLDLALLRIMLLLSENYTVPTEESPAPKSKNTYLAMRDYIEAHYPEPLSLSSLSEEMSISPQYAARVFRRHAGQSVTAFIQNVRIGKAQELLRSTPLSISEISYAVGFSSPYYFTRLFSRTVGASPSDFRRAAREEL